jgi:hypothetical protein
MQQRSFAALFVASSVLLAAVAAQATPQSGSEPHTNAAATQVATLPAPQRTPATRAPSLRTNELRADPRWPQFKGCIENSSTPEAFRACLQNIFVDEMAAERPHP